MSKPASAALRYLEERVWLGIKFGLETMRALCEALGHPERAAPCLLVAGTNGKGSVVACLDAALRGAGRRVGRYTSPHLQRVHERIAVDGREIDDAGLERAVGRVRDAAEGLVRRGAIPGHPTYFETLTAAAFEHFRHAGVDVAVLEVGMGGRLDATNVSEPVASAIVSVARDHEAFLGRRLESIAREKAGVLRAGRSGVVGPLRPSAARAVRAEARRIGARLVEALDDVHVEERRGRLDVTTPGGAYRGLTPLPGAHQRANLVVALRLLEEAGRAGVEVAPDGVAAALSRVRWPGRLQSVAGAPPLLLDGAHNPEGARALAAHLTGAGPFVLLFGAMADKDVAGMARALFPRAAAVVLCRLAESRAAAPAEIAARCGRLAAAAVQEDSVSAGLARARSLAGPRGQVVVAGSLYLVGEVLDRLDEERARSRSIR